MENPIKRILFNPSGGFNVTMLTAFDEQIVPLIETNTKIDTARFIHNGQDRVIIELEWLSVTAMTRDAAGALDLVMAQIKMVLGDPVEMPDERLAMIASSGGMISGHKWSREGDDYTPWSR